MLKQADAKVWRYGGVEALVGEELFDLVAVIEFPSDATMRQFLDSDAYAALEIHREQAFKFIQTYACKPL